MEDFTDLLLGSLAKCSRFMEIMYFIFGMDGLRRKETKFLTPPSKKKKSNMFLLLPCLFYLESKSSLQYVILMVKVVVH